MLNVYLIVIHSDPLSLLITQIELSEGYLKFLVKHM